jgi:hypothetical protein
VVQLRLQRAQARFDVAQTLAIGELREGHAQVLIPTREPRDLRIARVAIDAGAELARRDVGHQFGEDGAAWQHPAFWLEAPDQPHSGGNGDPPKISLR